MNVNTGTETFVFEKVVLALKQIFGTEKSSIEK